jgi:hypothetical protein
MGAVIDLFGDVDKAWDAYAEKARQIENSPRLLSDRQFNEELARLHERWRKLFLRSEGR